MKSSILDQAEGKIQKVKGEIKKVFGSKNGSTLKKLIYRLFDEEVGRRPMGEVIKS